MSKIRAPFSSKKILVTGANGFVGQALLKQLSSTHHLIYGLDHREPSNTNNVHFADFYIQDISKKFLIKNNFDIVFHLSALNLTNISTSSKNLYFKTNTQGTLNLIDAVNTKRFIYISTSRVYPNINNVFDEESEPLPENSYEQSKMQGEIICNKKIFYKNLLILRPVNIIGPGQQKKAAIPYFIENAMANKPIEIFVPYKTKIQLLHINDVIAFFMLVLNNNDAYGLYNLVSNNSIEIDKLAKLIIKFTHSKSKVIFLNRNDSTNPIITSNKLLSDFKWSPNFNAHEALLNCCQHYLLNQCE